METVRSSREIERMFVHGQRSANPLLVVIVTDGPAEGRVAVIAGKRLGGAVVRNRLKRVLRASIGRLGGPWAGKDVALVARERLGTAGTREIDSAARDALRRVGVIGRDA